MEIMNLVGGKPPDNSRLDKTDFMNLRRLQPREKLANAQANSAWEDRPAIDILIRGLVDLLPKRDAIWPLEERAKWLRLAAGIFDLGYKAGAGQNQELSVAVVKLPVAHDKP